MWVYTNFTIPAIFGMKLESKKYVLYYHYFNVASFILGFFFLWLIEFWLLHSRKLCLCLQISLSENSSVFVKSFFSSFTFLSLKSFNILNEKKRNENKKINNTFVYQTNTQNHLLLFALHNNNNFRRTEKLEQIWIEFQEKKNKSEREKTENKKTKDEIIGKNFFHLVGKKMLKTFHSVDVDFVFVSIILPRLRSRSVCLFSQWLYTFLNNVPYPETMCLSSSPHSQHKGKDANKTHYDFYKLVFLFQ